MSNYEFIYNNTTKKFIINIVMDYIRNIRFPDAITIDRGKEDVTVRYRDWTIFTVYTTEISDEDLLLKMLNYIIYL